MSRLIDADALINELNNSHYPGAPYVDAGISIAIGKVCNAPTIEPEQRWIPCSDRLPEEHIGFYLVTVQKRRITTLNVIGCDDTVYDIDIARWDYDRRAPQRGYHWCKADKVIAWMPLPEPWREEEQ